jgi:hypothetical protein
MSPTVLSPSLDSDDGIDGYCRTAEQLTDANGCASEKCIITILLVGAVHLFVGIHLGGLQPELEDITQFVPVTFQFSFEVV